MKNNLAHTTNDKTTENIFCRFEPLVGMPPLQLNEIYNDDSFELCKRVPAKTVDLILEDMPYNTTACEWDVKIDLQLYWETRLRILKPTGVIVLTASQPFTSKLVMSNYKMFKYEWIWIKNRGSNFASVKKIPIKEHESCLVFYNSKITYNPIMQERTGGGKQRVTKPFKKTRSKISEHGVEVNGAEWLSEDRYPSSWQKFNCEVGMHPTQKPVGLFEYLIKTYTNEGELVFDGFGGSGTTAIAAYRTKRNFIVIEKDKRYFEIASKRLYQERNPLSTFDEAS